MPASSRRCCATTAIPAIAGVDTRALARHLRANGCLRGDRHRARRDRRRTAAERGRAGRAALGGPGLRRPGLAAGRHRVRGARRHAGRWIGIVDLGLKTNIVRAMRHRGARVRVFPHTADRVGRAGARHRRRDPLAGPGRSGAARRPRSRWRGRSSTTAGRCSGSASATRSSAGPRAPTRRRLRFGHHGANHPVQDLELGPRPGDRPEPRGPGRRRLAARRVGLPGQPAQPQRRLGRGAAPPRRCRSRPSSTTPRARRGRSTRWPSSTGSSAAATAGSDRRGAVTDAGRKPASVLILGLRAGRHRPGRRVRLRRDPGLPRAARGGRPDDPASTRTRPRS